MSIAATQNWTKWRRHVAEAYVTGNQNRTLTVYSKPTPDMNVSRDYVVLLIERLYEIHDTKECCIMFVLQIENVGNTFSEWSTM